MPRKYQRKEGAKARVVFWKEEELLAAFHEMDKKEMKINEISRRFGIPSRTLRRRYAQKNKTKLTLGKHPVLGLENEKRLVTHILKLGEAGFPPNRQNIRKLAYQFAEKLQLKHNFDHENQMAGSDWFKSFIERNPMLSIRQAEGLSVARAKGLNRDEVNNFFELLTEVMAENDLLDKPERIYNMDESGVQLNNKPGKVVAKKGAKVVNSVTSAEKGETMTIVACCNAIGNFLPPVIIIKGVNKKPEFETGLPLGSKVYMNRKSAYINTELFYRWLTEHFIPLKPQGKVLLILDGHSSHSSAPDMLQAASDNDVILLCLPSHTTSVLQPLDRSVFGPLKTYFNHETNQFIRTNPNKKINRYNTGQLIRNAWVRAATPGNAQAGFRGSGIYPLNPNALPDTTFVISDIALSIEGRQPNLTQTSSSVSRPELPQSSSSAVSRRELPQTSSSAVPRRELPQGSSSMVSRRELPQPSSSVVPRRELPQPSSLAVPRRELPQTSSSAVFRPDLPQSSSLAVSRRELMQNSSSAVPRRELRQASSSTVSRRELSQPSSSVVPRRGLPQPSSSAVSRRELPLASSSAISRPELPHDSSSVVSPPDLPQSSSSVISRPELSQASSSKVSIPELPQASLSAVSRPELPLASSSPVSRPDLPLASSSVISRPELPHDSSSPVSRPDLPLASSSAISQSELPHDSSSVVSPPDLPQSSSSVISRPELSQASPSMVSIPELPQDSLSAVSRPELPLASSSVDAKELPQTSSTKDAQPQLPQTSHSIISRAEQPRTSALTFASRQLQTSSSKDSQPIISSLEDVSGSNLNVTPPNQISTLFDRGSPSLLIDPDMLKDITIADIGDDTLAILESIDRYSQLEKETPSKFLIEASPIPKIPTTLSKRAKQSADILNTVEKIQKKRDVAKKKKCQIQRKTDNKNKTKSTKAKIKKSNVNNKDKKKGKKVKAKQKRTWNRNDSEEDEDDAYDLSEKENDFFLKYVRASRKRPIINSSNSDNEDDSVSRNYHKKKGKETKGLPVKKTKSKQKESDNDSEEENFCIECFESYQNTKSKSDWIQCISCQKWLHETCTMFRNYCTRCGQLKALASSP